MTFQETFEIVQDKTKTLFFLSLTSLVDFLKATEHTTLKLIYAKLVAEHYNKVNDRPSNTHFQIK